MARMHVHAYMNGKAAPGTVHPCVLVSAAAMPNYFPKSEIFLAAMWTAIHPPSPQTPLPQR